MGPTFSQSCLTGEKIHELQETKYEGAREPSTREKGEVSFSRALSQKSICAGHPVRSP